MAAMNHERVAGQLGEEPTGDEKGREKVEDRERKG